ncbi:helix-turn-helix domain-containing protein [Acuticoccus mangrovi]|uniref:helix-turn-helix domain-containing protein n=1 Tax=Acuticoccus mangrovi TaxID=2796142 RepID=UPI001E44CCE2|nr:ImmA/IrrE family metallo-endopeptidase [Acuticoccus mangrovi]
MLLLARQYRGRSQSQVADAAGLDQGHYSRLERGLLNGEPGEATIVAVANALGFPKSYFFQSDEIAGLPLSVHEPAWRKRASVAAGELKRLHAELNLRIMHIRRFLQAVDIEAERPLPSIDADEAGGADKVALLIRRAWMVPDGPVKNLTALCERAGILVVHCKFSERIDGVTMRIRDVPPLIFLNTNAPSDRMRHSLAHELGHLIMHRVPTSSMEDEADLFASEFLAPIAQLRSDLIGGRITLDRLVRLKGYWKVSVASLLYRATRSGLLTQNQAGYLWRQLSSRGWKKREPEETQFEREQPRLYPQVIALHENDLGYDPSDIARMLHIDLEDVRSLYGLAADDGKRRHLRVIK